MYRGLIEIEVYPSDAVPVCEDYKRIAGSGAYLKSFAPAPKYYFFFIGYELFHENEIETDCYVSL